MATDVNEVLRGLITSVQQRPDFGPDRVRRQVIVVHFTTPHEFKGQVEMSLADWTDPDVRNDKVFQAVINLEGPFWEEPKETKKGK